MNTSPNKASAQALIAQVRAGLILRGTTFTAWSRAHGIAPSATRQALYGTWAGPRGREVRAQILKAAGVMEAQS